MRTYPASYTYALSASEKYPRFVVAITFDEDDVLYLTSHAGIPSVPEDRIENVLREPSAVSMRIVPDEARTEIGTISFECVDKDSSVTNALRARLGDGLGLKGKRVQLWHGFAGADFSAFQLFGTQIVADLTYHRGVYAVKCADITRELRKDIFEPKVARLSASVAVGDSTINVVSTAGFEMIEHGTGWTDAPSQTVGYFRIGDAVYRYTGKTDATFTGVTQGVLNSRAVPQTVDVSLPDERKPQVEEFIYLELPAVKAIYAIMTGKLHGQGSATLPAHWHQGIDPSWVKLADFTGIGTDLWNPDNELLSLVTRFAGLKKASGKAFLEKELFLLLGCYPMVYADGTIGIRRMNPVLADAPFDFVLDASNIVSSSALQYDMDGMYNSFRVDWNHDNNGKATRITQFVDVDSIALHGRTDTKKLTFKGLYGGRHTDATVRDRINAYRDRYTHPPERMGLTVLPSIAAAEVGDIARVRGANIRDFAGSTAQIDRSFEIQRTRLNAATGELEFELFGSTGRAGATATTGAGGEGPGGAYNVPDALYQVGTDLASILDITGSNPGVVDAGTYTLAGGEDLTDEASIFYYDGGDLVVPDGVTINIEGNVQIRVAGFLELNGDINGRGKGLEGQEDTPGYGTTAPGLQGAIGTVRGMDGIAITNIILGRPRYATVAAVTTAGKWTSIPSFPLVVTETDVLGIPTDLRGTSGGAGGKLVVSKPVKEVHALGGTGANSGAGLCILCRGMSIGASGSIDLSGDDAATPSPDNLATVTMYPGAGAPGAPGGLLILLDGPALSIPDLSEGRFIANVGTCGAPRVRTMASPSGGSNPWTGGALTPYFEGYLDPATTDDGSLANSAHRIQYLPSIQAPEEDAPTAVPAPIDLTATGISSGVALTLTLPPFEQFDSTEIHAASSNDRSGAALVWEGKSSSALHLLGGSAITRYYWARNQKAGVYSAWYPSSETGGVSGTST